MLCCFSERPCFKRPAGPARRLQVCAHVWEFCAAFVPWYLCNRLMMWHVHSGTEGGSQELWRGSQVCGLRWLLAFLPACLPASLPAWPLACLV
jgi:hypothetical protein